MNTAKNMYTNMYMNMDDNMYPILEYTEDQQAIPQHHGALMYNHMVSGTTSVFQMESILR